MPLHAFRNDTAHGAFDALLACAHAIKVVIGSPSMALINLPHRSVNESCVTIGKNNFFDSVSNILTSSPNSRVTMRVCCGYLKDKFHGYANMKKKQQQINAAGTNVDSSLSFVFRLIV